MYLFEGLDKDEQLEQYAKESNWMHDLKIGNFKNPVFLLATPQKLTPVPGQHPHQACNGFIELLKSDRISHIFFDEAHEAIGEGGLSYAQVLSSGLSRV